MYTLDIMTPMDQDGRRTMDLAVFRRAAASLLTFGLLVFAGCDSESGVTPPSDEDSAVLVGSVESANSGSAQMMSGQATEATTVAAGTVNSDGSLDVVATAEVSADGTFRIEGVPANRSGLVVRAESDAGAEVGRVFVHATTQAETETAVAPINASTTLHAQVTVAAHGGSPSPEAGAETALFLKVSGDAAAGAGSVSALADAYVEARSAFHTTVESEGAAIDAGSWTEILVSAATDTDARLHAGASVESEQRAFVEGVVDAALEAGARADGMAVAFAAAATRLDAMLEAQGEGAIRLEGTRNALRANVRARSAAIAEAEGAAGGLTDTGIQTLAQVEAAVEGSASAGEMASALADIRAGLVAQITGSLLGNLPGLPGEIVGEVEAQLEAAAETSQLWVVLDGEANAEAQAAAIASWRSDLESEVTAWVDTLPAEEAAEIDLDATIQVFVALGAGASLSH